MLRNLLPAKCITFAIHSFALYNKISDMRFIAMLNGIIVCSLHPGEVPVWFPPVQTEQNTASHVSQKSNSWLMWIEHLGITCNAEYNPCNVTTYLNVFGTKQH